MSSKQIIAMLLMMISALFILDHNGSKLSFFLWWMFFLGLTILFIGGIL